MDHADVVLVGAALSVLAGFLYLAMVYLPGRESPGEEDDGDGDDRL